MVENGDVIFVIDWLWWPIYCDQLP